MSELLNSGKVGHTVFKNLAQQRQEIVQKWSESGLLDGLSAMEPKRNIAQLLESEASHLLNEVTIKKITRDPLDRY